MTDRTATTAQDPGNPQDTAQTPALQQQARERSAQGRDHVHERGAQGQERAQELGTQVRNWTQAARAAGIKAE